MSIRSGFRAGLILGGLSCLIISPGMLVGTRAGELVPASPPAILQELRSFGTVATVLHVGAHPDDENTALITYFARGRGYRTAYLSLTRGDGGQNEIGREFDEKLGVARTQELLAARRLDGGRQFFTRAIDFGFSKTPEETLRFWDRDQVLGDVVRVIRQFRPDVIVTRFPIPPGSGGHGHHTASAMLAVEAFKLAGDPNAYPEQLAEGIKPWQPKRVVWNGWGGRGGGALSGSTVTVDIGGQDPVTGESFGAIAARSRGMHLTQGFGNPGGRGGGGPNPQTFANLGGAPATKDLMDDIDTTWARIPDAAEIGSLTEKAIAAFNPDDPSATVPALLAIRARLAGITRDVVVADKQRQLDRILQASLGLTVETASDRAEVVPGERCAIHETVSLKSAFPVRWVQTRSPFVEGGTASARDLGQGKPQTVEAVLHVPVDAPVTQPYWLREEGASGIFKVADARLIGMPENPPAFPTEYVFDVNGQELIIQDTPAWPNPENSQARPRTVDVIPPVRLHFASDVSLFAPGSTRSLTIEVTSARTQQKGVLRVDAPRDWTVLPVEQPFEIAQSGQTVVCTFKLTAPPSPTVGRLRASATVGGRNFATDRVEINYAHLPFILLQPPAQARLVCTGFAVRGKKVGYLPGAGDSTDRALEELGYVTRKLAGADLTPEGLNGLDAVVIGVRAFNERADLAGKLTNLFDYVASGGTLVVQYNRPNGLRAQPLGPYPLSIQGPAPQLRVTDEQTPVTFLAPESAVLTSPNRLSAADFEGWVQERGAYFPSSWDKDHYETILAMSDPGEEPLQSSLLVAKHGKGYYVYTGLAFFRQLPAGVPGAYRFFANLVSLGK